MVCTFSLAGLSSINILINQEIVDKLKTSKLKISLENGTKNELLEYRAFWCKKQCFIWDETKLEFSKLIGLEKFICCSDLSFNKNDGLSKEEQILRFKQFLLLQFLYKNLLSIKQKFFLDELFMGTMKFWYQFSQLEY